jgi:hypothetical protein
MITVWKYKLSPGLNTYQMPFDAEILSAQTVDGEVYCWAKVNDQMTRSSREIYIAGTGHSLYDDLELRFIDTVTVEGWMKWHVFEVLDK